MQNIYFKTYENYKIAYLDAILEYNAVLKFALFKNILA